MTSKPPRRRFQFSLKTMMVVVTLFAGLLSLLAPLWRMGILAAVSFQVFMIGYATTLLTYTLSFVWRGRSR